LRQSTGGKEPRENQKDKARREAFHGKTLSVSERNRMSPD
jgi:hypothetical protein